MKIAGHIANSLFVNRDVFMPFVDLEKAFDKVQYDTKMKFVTFRFA